MLVADPTSGRLAGALKPRLRGEIPSLLTIVGEIRGPPALLAGVCNYIFMPLDGPFCCLAIDVLMFMLPLKRF